MPRRSLSVLQQLYSLNAKYYCKFIKFCECFIFMKLRIPENKMAFEAIRESQILTKISEFTVIYYHW